MKKIFSLILVVIIVSIVISSQIEKKRISNNIQETTKQIQKLKKDMEEYAKDQIYNLQIQDWEFTTENGLDYIRGSVKNISSYDITYFKLVGEFKDGNGNVLDSEFTNSIQTIKPNSLEEFEIIKKHDDRYKNASVYIDKIRVE